MATVKVTLVKSLNGRLANHKACVKGLGLLPSKFRTLLRTAA